MVPWEEKGSFFCNKMLDVGDVSTIKRKNILFFPFCWFLSHRCTICLIWKGIVCTSGAAHVLMSCLQYFHNGANCAPVGPFQVRKTAVYMWNKSPKSLTCCGFHLSQTCMYTSSRSKKWGVHNIAMPQRHFQKPGNDITVSHDALGIFQILYNVMMSLLSFWLEIRCLSNQVPSLRLLQVASHIWVLQTQLLHRALVKVK